MTAEELWMQSGLTGKYEAWSFGEAPDKLASLVKDGIKTATCSAYDLYEAEARTCRKLENTVLFLILMKMLFASYKRKRYMSRHLIRSQQNMPFKKVKASGVWIIGRRSMRIF